MIYSTEAYATLVNHPNKMFMHARVLLKASNDLSNLIMGTIPFMQKKRTPHIESGSPTISPYR